MAGNAVGPLRRGWAGWVGIVKAAAQALRGGPTAGARARNEPSVTPEAAPSGTVAERCGG